MSILEPRFDGILRIEDNRLKIDTRIDEIHVHGDIPLSGRNED